MQPFPLVERGELGDLYRHHHPPAATTSRCWKAAAGWHSMSSPCGHTVTMLKAWSGRHRQSRLCANVIPTYRCS